MPIKIDIDYKHLESLAATLPTKSGIAKTLGITSVTLSNRLKSDAEFRAAFERGYAINVAKIKPSGEDAATNETEEILPALPQHSPDFVVMLAIGKNYKSVSQIVRETDFSFDTVQQTLDLFVLNRKVNHVFAGGTQVYYAWDNPPGGQLYLGGDRRYHVRAEPPRPVKSVDEAVAELRERQQSAPLPQSFAETIFEEIIEPILDESDAADESDDEAEEIAEPETKPETLPIAASSGLEKVILPGNDPLQISPSPNTRNAKTVALPSGGRIYLGFDGNLFETSAAERNFLNNLIDSAQNFERDTRAYETNFITGGTASPE